MKGGMKILRQEINIFDLLNKINECQQNYYEHILRMPTDLIPLRLFDYDPKGRLTWGSEWAGRLNPCR
jgi:hypothetical protein